MKLAFVYDAVYPWVKGGAEKRIFELGRRMAQKGHQVHVFGIKWWDGADVMEYEGMVLHGVCGKMDLYVQGRRSISEAMIFGIKLMPHLAREKFDLIDVSVFPYFSCFSVKLISVLRRTPLIFTWHEVWGEYWYEYMGKPGLFGKIVEILVSKLTSRSIAVSETTKKGLGSLGVSVKNVYIVPNGIDLKKIGSIQPSVHKCDIIFIGRLIREKNVDLLIEAMVHVKRSMPDVKCYIIGDGPEKERLVGLASGKALSDNIRFTGFMGTDEIIARLKSCKALVLPSVREGFGMVVIESFACGLPVITVLHPRNAASELVDEHTGLLIKPDVFELAEAIRLLISDTSLREEKSISALNRSKDYDWDRIVRKLMVIYEEAL